MNINIIIVDDFPLYRDALTAAIEQDLDLNIVAEAQDPEEAIEQARIHKPDIMVLDLHLNGNGGVGALAQIHQEFPEMAILVVTADEKVEVFLDAIAAGASGYLTKRASGKEIIQAVIQVSKGGTVVPPFMLPHLLKDYSQKAHNSTGAMFKASITQREQDVLSLVVKGLTDKEISQQLFISPRTVQNHLTNIRSKTGIKRRAALACWALEHARA